MPTLGSWSIRKRLSTLRRLVTGITLTKFPPRHITLLIQYVEIKVKQEYCGNLYEVSHPKVIHVASHPAELRPRKEPEL